MRALGVLLVTAAVMTAPANAQESQPEASANNGRASASVVQPLGATVTEGLSFGSFTLEQGQGGEIIVDSAGGNAAYSGALTPVCGSRQPCTPSPAVFTVSGQSDRTYGIGMPSKLTIEGEATGTRMLIGALTVTSRNDSSRALSGRLDRDGMDRISVGGNLQVPENSRPDRYRGDLTVTVFYF